MRAWHSHLGVRQRRSGTMPHDITPAPSPQTLLGAGLAATVLVTNLILRTARDRTGPILLVALMAVLVGSPSTVAAGTEPSCDLDPSTGRLDVTVPAGWVVGLHRDQAGVILINGAACGRATVTNVDRIRVVGDEGLQWLQIDLANGGFAPGKTNEPGDSDEVEFTILLGTGGDRIIVSGTSGPDRIRLGWTGSPSGCRP